MATNINTALATRLVPIDSMKVQNMDSMKQMMKSKIDIVNSSFASITNVSIGGTMTKVEMLDNDEKALLLDDLSHILGPASSNVRSIYLSRIDEIAAFVAATVKRLELGYTGVNGLSGVALQGPALRSIYWGTVSAATFRKFPFAAATDQFSSWATAVAAAAPGYIGWAGQGAANTVFPLHEDISQLIIGHADESASSLVREVFYNKTGVALTPIDVSMIALADADANVPVCSSPTRLLEGKNQFYASLKIDDPTVAPPGAIAGTAYFYPLGLTAGIADTLSQQTASIF